MRRVAAGVVKRRAAMAVAVESVGMEWKAVKAQGEKRGDRGETGRGWWVGPTDVLWGR